MWKVNAMSRGHCIFVVESDVANRVQATLIKRSDFWRSGNLARRGMDHYFVKGVNSVNYLVQSR
jgi:hypothetical protein